MKYLLLMFVITSLSYAKEGGGGGGGSGGNNGGNGSDGFLQAIVREKILGVLKHSENERVLSKKDNETLKATIEKGIPFIAVVPELIEKDRYADPDGKPSQISEKRPDRRIRLLDTKKNVVDARVVKDLSDKRWIVQWDEISLKEATDDLKKIRHPFLRDVLHEVFRYAFFSDLIEENDDDRRLSGKFYFPENLEQLGLKSVGYRLDLKRRATELITLSNEQIRLLNGDAKGHSMAKGVQRASEANIAHLRVIERDPAEAESDTLSREDIAKEFDLLELHLIQARQRILMQLNWGYRPLTVENPNSPRNFKARAEYLVQIAQRIGECIRWRQKLHESEWGRQKSHRYLSELGPWLRDFNRSEQPLSDAQLEKLFDSYEKELVDQWEWLKKNYPPLK